MQPAARERERGGGGGKEREEMQCRRPNEASQNLDLAPTDRPTDRRTDIVRIQPKRTPSQH